VQYTRDKGLSFIQVCQQMIECCSQWDEGFFKKYRNEILENLPGMKPLWIASIGWEELQRVVKSRMAGSGHYYCGWVAQDDQQVYCEEQSDDGGRQVVDLKRARKKGVPPVDRRHIVEMGVSLIERELEVINGLLAKRAKTDYLLLRLVYPLGTKMDNTLFGSGVPVPLKMLSISNHDPVVEAHLDNVRSLTNTRLGDGLLGLRIVSQVKRSDLVQRIKMIIGSEVPSQVDAGTILIEQEVMLKCVTGVRYTGHTLAEGHWNVLRILRSQQEEELRGTTYMYWQVQGSGGFLMPEIRMSEGVKEWSFSRLAGVTLEGDV